MKYNGFRGSKIPKLILKKQNFNLHYFIEILDTKNTLKLFFGIWNFDNWNLNKKRS